MPLLPAPRLLRLPIESVSHDAAVVVVVLVGLVGLVVVAKMLAAATD
jgi:hypothetical protein